MAEQEKQDARQSDICITAAVERQIIQGQKKLQKARKQARKHINPKVADEFDNLTIKKSRFLKKCPEQIMEEKLSARKKIIESLKKLLNPFKKRIRQ